MSSPRILTPLTTFQDIKSVWCYEPNSEFLLKGVWMCYRRSCPHDFLERQRMVWFNGDQVMFESKDCPCCGQKLSFLVLSIEVVKFSTQHVYWFAKGLYNFLTRPNTEGMRICLPGA